MSAKPPGILGMGFPFSELIQALSTERYVFVSYHHGYDHPYYDKLAALFAGQFCPVTDNSVELPFESENPDYIIQRIREQHITGTSCTIVLCGRDTPWRKYVDWEIKATLDKSHGLLGILLPTARKDIAGRPIVPARLYDNLESQFAAWTTWETITGVAGLAKLKTSIEFAKASRQLLARNERELMKKNETPPMNYSPAVELLMSLNRGRR